MTFAATVIQDLRYATRTMRRNAGFTAVSAFALALGIGVNTVAFTAYKAFVGRPLDGRNPETMVNLALRVQSGATSAMFSYPDYEAYRDGLHSLTGVIASSINQVRLTEAGDGDRAEIVGAISVSENFFEVLGVRAVRGRTFEAIPRAELATSAPVLISENYWQKRFGSDPGVLGKVIRLNGADFTIIGITPHDFTGTTVAVPSFWLPLSLDTAVHPHANRLRNREDSFCRLFGRLAPGVSSEQVQAEMTLVASRLRALHDPHSELSKEVTALVTPGSPLPGKLNANLRLTVILIMAATAMVLLIACANVASLQLARSTARQHELGVRLSLGASRSRLLRQLLTESALQGLVAGGLALPFTWMIMRIAVVEAGTLLPAEWTLIFDVNPDLTVFAYVLALSLLAGILFGLAPAIERSSSVLLSTVRGVGTTSVRSQRLRNAFIAAQVSISLALMIGGSMLIRSAIHTLNFDTGYDGDRVVDVSLQFPEELKYTSGHKGSIVRELRARVAALPGVSEVTSSRAPADNGGRRAAIELDGATPSTDGGRAFLYYTWVQPNYFQTLGIPMVSGRSFAPRDSRSEHSAIVSESAARRLWPGENPIGHSLRLDTDGQFHVNGELLPDGKSWEVAGVVRDTRGVTLDGSDSQQVYLPLPEDRIQDYPILVRTRSDPKLVIQALQPVIVSLDPGLMASVSTLQEMLRRTDSFLICITSAAIASAISLFGLLLASMGIYSTITYLVVVRTKEIGLRMAIGAKGRDILLLMMRESGRPVLAGLPAGMVLAAGVGRLLRGVLYGVSPVDALSYAAAAGFLVAVALFASCPPARRATRVDPIVALRYE